MPRPYNARPVSTDRLARIDEDQQRAMNSKWEQQTLLGRFGCTQVPKIVTPATVLPSRPDIPDCGERRPRLRSIQIIALAIINHASCAPTGKDILEWIQQKYPYFGLHHLALARIRTMLKAFFEDYDPPIVPLCTKYSQFAMPWDGEQFLTTPFAIVVGHFSILFPTNRGVFPLMQLPVELRLQIYEYSLSMPCKEWMRLYDWRLDKKQRNKELSRLYSRVHFEDERAYRYGVNFFRSPPTKDMLALLEVSRKLYDEAVPIFYRLNTLSSGDLYCRTFSCLLNGMGTARQVFIRNLSISFPYYRDPDDWASICQTICNFCQLEKLTLDITHFEAELRSAGHEKLLDVLTPLAQLRGIKELKIACQCDSEDSQKIHETIEKHLKPLITQPREDPPKKHNTGEAQTTVHAAHAPEMAGGSGTTKKRKTVTQSDNGEHTGEGAGEGEEKQQQQNKKLNVGA